VPVQPVQSQPTSLFSLDLRDLFIDLPLNPSQLPVQAPSQEFSQFPEHVFSQSRAHPPAQSAEQVPSQLCLQSFGVLEFNFLFNANNSLPIEPKPRNAIVGIAIFDTVLKNSLRD
jgi:hypothetical protein